MKKSILSLVAVALSVTLLGCPPPEGGDSGKTDGGDATTKPTDGDGGETTDGGEGTDGGDATDGGEAAGGGDPDLSHVKAGQDYVYDMVAAGNKMKMIYRVSDVKDGVISYETVTVMNMGGEDKEMPSGQTMTWPMKVEGGETGEAPKVDTKELPNETIKVGDMEFVCKVTETKTDAGTTKTWMPMKPDGVMTWPMMVKSETTGGAADTTMVLVEIKDK
ncbi:MAG: hypothetical protein KDD82_04785 [Planctomycetes bacterium]|nr:hypothetical protein [Planctomycetota bacterium]